MRMDFYSTINLNYRYLRLSMFTWPLVLLHVTLYLEDTVKHGTQGRKGGRRHHFGVRTRTVPLRRTTVVLSKFFVPIPLRYVHTDPGVEQERVSHTSRSINPYEGNGPWGRIGTQCEGWDLFRGINGRQQRRRGCRRRKRGRGRI